MFAENRTGRRAVVCTMLCNMLNGICIAGEFEVCLFFIAIFSSVTRLAASSQVVSGDSDVPPFMFHGCLQQNKLGM